MNLVDLAILLLVVGGLVGGYRLGFVTRVISWVGLAIGLLGALKLLPWVLDRMPGASSERVLLVSVVMVLGLSFAGQALGMALGWRVRPADRHGDGTTVDRLLGAVAGIVGATVLVWLLLPIAAQTRGTVASQVANSAIARYVDEHFPEPPDTMQALQALAGDGVPRVFEALRPTPDLGPPPPDSGLTPAIQAQVARSIVKVEGIACNRIQDGTGFVVADGLVVTNAHVVAGEKSTQLERDDGSRVNADVVAFDPAVDLAVLRAPRLNRPPLSIGESKQGDRGGVFGHPGGGNLRVAPFQVARRIVAVGRDIYNTARTEREVLELAAALRQGDSGSPLIDPSGRVVGVAFAIAPDRPDVAYALTTEALREIIGRAQPRPVATGPCVG